jgi:hypothetical protein
MAIAVPEEGPFAQEPAHGPPGGHRSFRTSALSLGWAMTKSASRV